MARQVRPRRCFHRLELQPESDRRAVFQRRLGRQCRHGPCRGFNSPRDLGGSDGGGRGSAGAGSGGGGGGGGGSAGKPRRRRCLLGSVAQAVADGVDVINFSISGSSTNFRDAVEIAFLYAADAGVFVAASAGNSGPAVSTVAHPGPWLTTVAAGGRGLVTPGNSVTLAHRWHLWVLRR
ncbi:MAG: S8 family serine peptidase [Betaproteobacteria bacterium]|nr:S8 family serine peptidase [Betaproteobacteria bacterium]